jgi:Holliday junction resolvase YEN1
VDGFSVETATLALARETASNFDENMRKKILQQMREPFYPWIPSQILKRKVPDLTNEFGARTRKKKKPRQQQGIMSDSVRIL